MCLSLSVYLVYMLRAHVGLSLACLSLMPLIPAASQTDLRAYFEYRRGDYAAARRLIDRVAGNSTTSPYMTSCSACTTG